MIQIAKKLWEVMSSNASSFFQNYLGMLPANSTKTKIESLYGNMTTMYSDACHEWMLDSLFHLSKLRGTYVRRGACWKHIGFQREDPVSDLRGGGFLALSNILYMVEKEQALALSMITKRSGREMGINYPWATAGVNITRMVAILFEVIQPHGVPVTSLTKKTYWHLIEEEEAFNRLFICGFVLLDATYDELEARYMDFPKVLEVTTRRFKYLLEQASCIEDIEIELLGRSTVAVDLEQAMGEDRVEVVHNPHEQLSHLCMVDNV